MRNYQVAFAEKQVALSTDSTADELAEYSSDFKVPILKDGELVVWDSLSIMEYVSEQHLQNRGWPADAEARSVARSISAEMHSSYPNVRNELPMNCRKKFENIELSTGAKREIERITGLWQKCRQEHEHRGEWLFGEYSIADAMFAPIALRFAGYSIPLSDAAQTYVTSVLNHPGIMEWIAAGKLETEVIAEDEI